MRKVAEQALKGVGDPALGEWRDWSGYAYHLRRRLSAEEATRVAAVADIRGTSEAFERFQRLLPRLPKQALAIAREEVGV